MKQQFAALRRSLSTPSVHDTNYSLLSKYHQQHQHQHEQHENAVAAATAAVAAATAAASAKQYGHKQIWPDTTYQSPEVYKTASMTHIPTLARSFSTTPNPKWSYTPGDSGTVGSNRSLVSMDSSTSLFYPKFDLSTGGTGASSATGSLTRHHKTPTASRRRLPPPPVSLNDEDSVYESSTTAYSSWSSNQDLASLLGESLNQ